MNDHVAVRIRGDGWDGEPAGTQVVLFQSAESDRTSPRGGPARVKNLAQDATGRLAAIAYAAEEV